MGLTALAVTGYGKAMSSNPTIWRATVLTLFPEMFPGPLGVSLAGKALASGLWALEVARHQGFRHRPPP